MRATEPLSADAGLGLRVKLEVLRLSGRWTPASVAWQAIITVLIAAYFGYPDRPLSAVFWMGWVFVGVALRVWRPLALPDANAQALNRQLRWHRVRVLFSAAAWGSAGVLLFDSTDTFLALALTIALVSSSIAFSFSASADGLALRLALPLLIGPVVFSLLRSPERELWLLGLIGASFIVLMLRLVQERSRQLEESIVLRLHAQEARDAKQRFLAAASHDLRQPLQALHLYHGVMARGDTSEKVIQSMGQCLDALDRLLDGILDIARLDSGRVQAQARAVHLPTLLLRVFHLHDALARSKSLRLRLHVRDVWVRTDPDLLERVLSNLLANGIRYTQQGGVLLAARPAGHEVRLQVIDTGIGIAPEHLPSIFEEFTQVGNRERAPDRGAGLGLATVQRLCQLLSVPVQVRSSPGQGTCFELRLPLASAPPPGQDVPMVTNPGAGGQSCHRVLLVEDHPMVSESLVQLMTGWQIEVLAVQDAEQALAALRHFAADTIISDWRLPGDMDGLALLQMAASHPGVQHRILLTGELGLEAPPDLAVLRKPVRPLRLKALLQRGPAATVQESDKV